MTEIQRPQLIMYSRKMSPAAMKAMEVVICSCHLHVVLYDMEAHTYDDKATKKEVCSNETLTQS